MTNSINPAATPYPQLFTQQQWQTLLNNADCGQSAVPVVKLFTPDANATWLLGSVSPESPDIAFGLCDLGLGCPELGCVSLPELVNLRGNLGLRVERERYCTLDETLSVYAEKARIRGRVEI